MRKLSDRWRRRWMKLAYARPVGWAARWCASLGMGPLYGALPLARLHPRGYISPRTRIDHPGFRSGRHCFLGDWVTVYQDRDGAGVVLGDGVHLHEYITIQTGRGGTVDIGEHTHVQPRCQFSAYIGAIRIGRRVEIAPGCAFYPYNHEMQAGTPIRDQALFTRSGITVEDDAWLGYGAVLLDGAHVGKGAVVAAGAVVNSQIPDNAIAAGAPARVVGHRPEP